MDAQTRFSVAWSEPYRMRTLPARVSAHAPQSLWSASHYFLSDLIGNVLKFPLRVLVQSTSRVGRSAESVSIVIKGNCSTFRPGFYFIGF
jgi:hypothetical protein